MKEKDKFLFYDTTTLEETVGLRERVQTTYIQSRLQERFLNETIRVKSASINDTGKYAKLLSTIKGLPHYCSIKLEHSTGRHTECITIWSPLAWNDRFLGTAGGGTGTGGDTYITKPNNTSRGLTLPKAVCNGFTGAMTDAGNTRMEWALDKKTGGLDWERIENWRARSTHFMSLVGKAVAEILHERPVRYSYLHGGSGGGRQSMVEAQEFPHDYDGIWASCPAINWNKFVLGGLWPIAVMNSYGHVLSPRKIKYFLTAAQNSVGGAQAYYRRGERVDFDANSVVGDRTKDGPITEVDAEIMTKIWSGPRRENGEPLWHGFRPGVLFWNVFIPIGAFYYSLPRKKPKPFIISKHFARWVAKNPKQTFEDITMEAYVKLFDQSVSELAVIGADKTDLTAFAEAGGKLIIDHGIDDPLIPVDGTIDYYEKLCEAMGGKARVDSFSRLYITPGDGHGSCNWHGPGITESDGMRALIDWVEKGIPPGALRVVQVDRNGKTICERMQVSY